MMRVIFLGLILVLMSLGVQASPLLSPSDIDRFLKTVEGVHQLSETMSQEGREKIISYQNLTDKSGVFAPYKNSVSILKSSHKTDYKALESFITGKGYGSAEEWALYGDAIMAAYMTHKITPEARKNMQMLQTMSPDMQAAIPSQAKVMIEKGRAMMKALEDVPPQNAQTIKPYLVKIDEEINKLKK
jgi:hypothetical protein